MVWFADLSPCTYFTTVENRLLRAVGWLEGDHPYSTGATPRAVYERLKSLLSDAWQPWVTAGIHTCSLCQFDGESGTADLFVPGDGVVYVCPRLIVHYINAHHYRPPDEFCDAVLRCPGTRTMEYKRLLLDNGGRSLLD